MACGELAHRSGGSRFHYGGFGRGHAQTGAVYPSKPVRIIPAYSAGGFGDLLPSAIAAGLTERLGERVIVENRPGAHKSLPYDPVKDFAPVALCVTTPLKLGGEVEERFGAPSRPTKRRASRARPRSRRVRAQTRGCAATPTRRGSTATTRRLRCSAPADRLSFRPRDF